MKELKQLGWFVLAGVLLAAVSGCTKQAAEKAAVQGRWTGEITCLRLSHHSRPAIHQPRITRTGTDSSDMTSEPYDTAAGGASSGRGSGREALGGGARLQRARGKGSIRIRRMHELTNRAVGETIAGT